MKEDIAKHVSLLSSHERYTSKKLHNEGFTLVKPKTYYRSQGDEREQNKAAFTLIELIVVMAVLAILVLLAAPKFLNYTEKARAAQAVNDIKTLETKLDEYLISNEGLPESFKPGTPGGGQLYDRTGEIDTAPDSLKVVDKTFNPESTLPGIFYTTDKGDIIYEDKSSLSGSEDSVVYEPVVPEGISFTAFATYASFFYANGYQMDISDLVAEFTEKHYYWANGVYLEKTDEINILEKLNLFTSALLTGNIDNIPSIHDLNKVENDILRSFPRKISVSIANLSYDTHYSMDRSILFNANLLVNDNEFKQINEDFKGLMVKHSFGDYYPDYNYYVRLSPIGWELVNNPSYGITNKYYPIVQVIDPTGLVHEIVLLEYLRMGMDTTNNRFFLGTRHAKTGNDQTKIKIYKEGYVNPNEPVYCNYNTVNDSFASRSNNFLLSYPNYNSALSGKASTIDELLVLMNTDARLQHTIAAELEKQEANVQNELMTPSLAADGLIYYSK